MTPTNTEFVLALLVLLTLVLLIAAVLFAVLVSWWRRQLCKARRAVNSYLDGKMGLDDSIFY